jgi:integrase
MASVAHSAHDFGVCTWRRLVVVQRLGHATVSITLDTYSHAIPAMQEEAAALIAGLVFAGG